jgi:Holliday junction resolvase RusA-like endonuclease
MLPRPPSVNQLYRNVPNVGRVKTAAYKSWIQAAGWILKAMHRKPRIEGKYWLLVEVGPTRADIDNLFKAMNDLLQSHEIVTNDNKAEDLRIKRSDDVPKDQIRVTVAPWSSDPWQPLGEIVATIVGEHDELDQCN